MDSRMKGVFAIVEGERLKKSIFRRVGTAYENRDASWNVYLDAVPLGGKLNIRDLERHEQPDGPTEEKEAA